MTPDRNEPDTNPQWQSTSTHSGEWEDESDPLDDLSPQTNALEDEDLDFTAGDNPGKVSNVSQSRGDETALSTSFLSRFELLRQVGQQSSPILIPLLLGGLTFLCTLLLVRNGHSYFSFNLFWPIGIIIIALSILQGMVLYYAGSNTVYGMLSIAGGLALFLLIGCFTIFGPLPFIILLLTLVVVSILGMRTSVRSVKEGTAAIVSFSGRYSRTLLPGLNLLLPWEQIEKTVNTREVQWQCPEQQVRISREEDVSLHATISYQLEPEDAHIAALQVEKWEESLRELFKAAVQTVAGELTPEDFLVWSKGFRSRQPVNNQQQAGNASRWERINAILYQRMRDKVALWGVQINWIQVYDIMLVPHVDMAGIADEDTRGTSPPRATKQPAAGTSPYSSFTGTPQSSTASGAAAKGLKSMNPAQLINAYNSVKQGAISDPTTIRTIAARFDMIANHPEESQKVEFDAARAARNLYAQAQLLEDQASQMGFSDDFDDVTQPDWNMRRPGGNNLTDY